MINLTIKERQHFKALAHNLDPVVMIGDKGLTDAVIREIDINLKAHELIKIRVLGNDRDYRSGLIEEICGRTNSVLIQHIGKLIIVYRPK